MNRETKQQTLTFFPSSSLQDYKRNSHPSRRTRGDAQRMERLGHEDCEVRRDGVGIEEEEEGEKEDVNDGGVAELLLADFSQEGGKLPSDPETSKEQLRENIVDVLEGHLVAVSEWKGKRSRARDKASVLFSNAKSSRIQHVEGCGYLVEGETRAKNRFYPGVTGRLGWAFWPWRDPNASFRDPIEAKRRAPPPASNYRNVAPSCPTSGLTHGTIVHQQVAECVRCLWLGVADAPIWPDPCVLNIFSFLLLQKWIPLRSELPLFSEEANLCTAADMIVAIPDADELVVVELKTNYEWEVRGPVLGDARMLPPFQEFADCPENRHQLQLGATVALIRKGYDIRPDGAYLLYSLSKRRGIDLVAFPPEVDTVDFFDQLWSKISLSPPKSH